jgi:hypothetical protein
MPTFRFRLFAAALATFVTSPAVAVTTTLVASGRVEQIETLKIVPQPLMTVETPPSPITIGDTFTLKATFDLGQAQLDGFLDAGPTANIYDLPIARVEYSIGSFTRTFVAKQQLPGEGTVSVHLWNGLVELGGADSQSFSFQDNHFAPWEKDLALPFSSGAFFGEGYGASSVTFAAIDPNGTVRNTDLIGEMRPLSLFSDRSLTFSQVHTVDARGERYFTFVSATNVTARLLSGVPEPTTWILMILGFGAVGGAMRRRRWVPTEAWSACMLAGRDASPVGREADGGVRVRFSSSPDIRQPPRLRRAGAVPCAF